MKTLRQHINEWKLTDSSNVEVAHYIYKYHPKNRWELIDIVRKKLSENIKCPNLNDIDVSNITDLDELFSFSCNYSDNDYYGRFNKNNIETIDLRGWDTSKVKNMRNLFFELKGLKHVYLSDKFTVINTPNISGLFLECESLEAIDLSSFDTRNVIQMNHMFGRCHNLKRIRLSNKFVLDKVESVSYMFQECYEMRKTSIINSDIEKWNVSNVCNFMVAFQGCDKSFIPSWYPC